VPRALVPLFATALLVASPAVAQQGCPEPVPESEWSVIMPLATTTLMLDIERIGDRMVAVGDRGHVLISDDEGRTWEQQRTPTRSLLTGAYFLTRELGWVVGHDAVILRTEDGGESWCRVHWAPELERPLFDVWFEDERNGFAVGAYGYFLRSRDGGLSWHEESLELRSVEGEADDPETEDEGYGGDPDDEPAWDDEWAEEEGEAGDLHLNRIIPNSDDRLYIVAEAGIVFRSDDRGWTWTMLDPPYDGSFFGGLSLDDGSFTGFGLRGNMFRTWDGGASWRKVRLPVDSSLFGAARLADGGLLVVGTAGVTLVSREGDRFRLVQRPDRKALVGAAATANGAVIVIGEPGVERLERSTLAGD
jgi:photosystem II stability/assembly factor-like uncharacterized protein